MSLVDSGNEKSHLNLEPLKLQWLGLNYLRDPLKGGTVSFTQKSNVFYYIFENLVFRFISVESVMQKVEDIQTEKNKMSFLTTGVKIWV